MNRKVMDFLSPVALKQTLYIPRVFRQISNWPTFLIHYIGMRGAGAVYIFRNGLEVVTREAVDAATLYVVFARREYGSNDQYSTVIDIGANIGAFSLYAASSSDRTVVYAYEPMPPTFAVLTENIKRNGLEQRVIASQCGVAGQRTHRRLYDQGASPLHSLYNKNPDAECIEIECITLADIFAKYNIPFCDLLKLDCEGAEFEILYAARPEDLAKIRRIRMEYHNRDVDPTYNLAALLTYLRSHNFTIRKLKQNSRNSGSLWLERTA